MTMNGRSNQRVNHLARVAVFFVVGLLLFLLTRAVVASWVAR
jgi:hypothetical protein